MTHEEKVNYMRIAASLCNYGFNNEQLDLLTSLYDEVTSNKGETDLKKVLQIEREVKERHQILENKKPSE